MTELLLDFNKYRSKASEVVGEGCVLLENKNNILPLMKQERVAVFGRMSFDYYKSGTGSGGLVNAVEVLSLMDVLEKSTDLIVDEKIKNIYKEWLLDNPFDYGEGWGQEPWYQQEMELSEELIVEARENNEVAIISIGRTAGEDKDNLYAEGSYLLSKEERNLIRNVKRSFDKVVVLLNVGNIIDMNWVEEFDIPAVMYIYQGGEVGALPIIDLLLGKINPSGKLVDTIVYDINDYPSNRDFGDPKKLIYHDDIYVGYRYFETFAKDKVQYPFGFGLSYTSFDIKAKNIVEKNDELTFVVNVKNTGLYSGKEVVQLYLKPVSCLIDRPERELVAYKKTKLLMPSESEEILLKIKINDLACFDEIGLLICPNSKVIEKGSYSFYLGNSIRNTDLVFKHELEKDILVEKLSASLYPDEKYNRLTKNKDGSLTEVEVNRMKNDIIDGISELTYQGNLGHKLIDVSEGKINIETFIAQLNDSQLAAIVRGEGMCSPKVTAGTAGSFGGVTDELLNYGIPLACCADGPSGIRMDCGTMAMSLPNGTLIASTFNDELVSELYSFLGLELLSNKIDTILGPGINIHRHPLNGRNFEYFSEDPYLTGMMAIAELNGLHESGVTGTIKHFAVNNQEYYRNFVDIKCSARALREIYLKAFEFAVKKGKAKLIMTSYNALNGLWTAGHRELCTNVLRSDWGFKGAVMTDWWAQVNDPNEKAFRANTRAMVKAQNDLYMVTMNANENSNHDNTEDSLKDGSLSRAYLQQCAINICNVVSELPCANNYENTVKVINSNFETSNAEVQAYIDADTNFSNEYNYELKGNDTIYGVNFTSNGDYEIELVLECILEKENEVAQQSVSIFFDNTIRATINVKANELVKSKINIGMVTGNIKYIKIHRQNNSIKLKTLKINKIFN